MSDKESIREEAGYLRKRTWDFIDKLEKLERKLDNSVDTDKRSSLQTRIKNTHRLLEGYKNDYEAMCEQAGIPQDIIGTDVSDHDATPSISRKIKSAHQIELPPLFIVPSRNPKFLGRQDSVREFIQLVLDGAPIAISGFKGMGGIGKTEIAKEVCHIFHETWKDRPDLPDNLIDILSQRKDGFFRDGILWIQFHAEQQTPKSLTEKLISQLIEQYPKVSSEINSLDGLSDVLAGKDVLMVLDSVEQNLGTFDYVLERFKGRLPLLITSRIIIPGINSIDIGLLADKESEALFLRYMDNSQLTGEEKEIVRELCTLLGNYPLLIKVIASRVKAGTSSLIEIFEVYKEKPLLLLDESNDSICTDQRHVDVRTCFMESFHSLDEEQQHVFLHTSLFNKPFTVEALATLLDDLDKTELGYIVNRFDRLSLINCLSGRDGKENTYELHPLMREFALDLLRQQIEMIPGREEEINFFLKDLQQKKEEKTLSEQLKDDPSLVKQAIEAVQYCDQVFDFSMVLEFMEVLDEPLTGLSYSGDRLSLYNLAKRAVVVALPDDYDEGRYWKRRADIEKQQTQLKDKFEFVGREKELTYFEDKFLFQSGSFILNFYTNGDGGVGKTQLLQQMLKLCRSRYRSKVISSDELIDFYYTEARSKAGIIDQVIRRLGRHHFQRVVQQLKKYRQTKDSSERQYLLDHAVTALRKDYEVFAAKSEKNKCTIILFFDTYEVIQSIDKEKKQAKSTDFSKWLEKDFFPALQSDNTRLVVAGRYPLINIVGKFVSKKVLSVFQYKEAVDFMFEYLKAAEFTKEEYQDFQGRFPHTEKLLQRFRYPLGIGGTSIWIYKFPNGYRKELGEEIWQALKDKMPVKKEKKLLEELKLTQQKLRIVVQLARRRPIYLALFMYWVRFSKNGIEPSKLVKDAQNFSEKKVQREFFENTIIEWLWHDENKREYIYCMTVAHRRMTSELMQHLTGDSPERCQKILLEDIRNLSFVKHKEDGQKGDVVLLHDEMRELIKTRWQDRIDPNQKKKIKILEKTIRYYKEGLLTPNYILTDFSCSQLGQGSFLKGIGDKVKGIKSFFFKKDGFLSALKTETKLTKDEMDKYSSALVKAARQEVLQERREVYTPELIEYAFMADVDNGVQLFCDEFDTAMEDGRSSYAGLLGREAEFCCIKHEASLHSALKVKLREVQYHIDGHQQDIKKALKIIASVQKEQLIDVDFLLWGKFKLWEGIAYFWLNDFDKTLLLLKKARGIFINDEGQEDLMFLAENWIGYTYYRKADFDQAESWMNQSLKGLLVLLEEEVKVKTRKRRNIQQHIQYAYGNLAMLHRYKGRFVESLRYAEMQFNIVESLPRNKKEIFRSLNTMAYVFAVAGHSMDARFYLEQAKTIYKEIPDPLLGGRMYINFSWLSYDSIESAYMIEYYRAEELHDTVDEAAEEEVQRIEEAIEYSYQAIDILQVSSEGNIAYKELADAYFNLGELYMMMPEGSRQDKWKKAEQAFIEAAGLAQDSQFIYSYIDALESLITLYYFWNRAAEKLSDEQKKENEQKQEQYRKELEGDLHGEMKRYPNLVGRYELTLGDIEFDQALDLLLESKQGDAVFRQGVLLLRSSFTHYLASALLKKEFNRDRYFLVLRVLYNRLNTLIRKMGDSYELALQWLKRYEKDWKDKIPEFSTVFEYVVLLHTTPEKGEEVVSQIKEKIKEVDTSGNFRYLVLLNKCLLDAYRLLAKRKEQEKFQEKLVGRFNRQSRVYRLLGDTHYTRFCYKRARKAIAGDDVASPLQITNPILRQGLEGCTDIIEGEFYFRRGGYGSLLEIYLHDELPYAQRRFEKQFEESWQRAFDLLKRGGHILEETVEQLTERFDADPEEKKGFFYKQKRYYHRQLAEAYFQLGELQMMNGQFQESDQGEAGAFEYLEKAIRACKASENHLRYDDAVQSYLNAIYFSGNDDWDSHEDVVKYQPYLEEKIQIEGYKYPWVIARFRITQGDVLFSRYFKMKEQPVETNSENYSFIPVSSPVRREELLPMFRYYVEACNYKAGFNNLSFEAGLRVLRRRIELIADSPTLDIIDKILPHIWQDGEHLRKKIEELESIQQLIRMRSLTGKLVKEYEK